MYQSISKQEDPSPDTIQTHHHEHAQPSEIATKTTLKMSQIVSNGCVVQVQAASCSFGAGAEHLHQQSGCTAARCKCCSHLFAAATVRCSLPCPVRIKPLHKHLNILNVYSQTNIPRANATQPDRNPFPPPELNPRGDRSRSN